MSHSPLIIPLVDVLPDEKYLSILLLIRDVDISKEYYKGEKV